MAHEIERKFLVASDGWRAGSDTGKHLVQAYLALDNATSVRIRIIEDSHAVLTIKFGISAMSRHEFEYPVPLQDARQMVEAGGGRVIDKIRYRIPVSGFVWEVDIYNGALSGLVTAEVELQSEDDMPALPDWLGRELTGESGWSNAALAIHGLPAEVALDA